MGATSCKLMCIGRTIIVASALVLIAAIQAMAGNIPLNTVTGSTTLTRTDLTVGKIFPISISRTYNSKSGYASPLGYGWALGYDKQLFTYPNSSVIIRTGPGQKKKYTYAGGNYTSPVGDTGVLTYDSATSTYTYTAKDGTKELYDTYGRLASLTDPKGTSLSFSYASNTKADLKGILRTSIDQATPSVIAKIYQLSRIDEKNPDGTTTGKYVTFAYDPASGVLTSLTDNLGRTINYGHDLGGNGNLTSVTGPGVSAIYGYNDPNNKHLLTSIDEGSGEYTNTYDSLERVTKQEYGKTTKVVTYTTPGVTSTVTTTVKNDAGTIISTESRTVTLDSNAQVVNEKDTLGNRIIYNRDAQSTLVTRQEWWKNNGTVTNPALVHDHAIEYAYDAKGNVTSKIEMDGRNNNTNTPSTVPASTFMYTTTYVNEYSPTDGLLTKVTETDPLQQVTVTTYEKGQLTSVSGPQGEIRATYYPDGNLHTVANTLTEPVVAPFGITTYQYTNGNLTTITDARGKDTTIHYDTNDQIDYIIDATQRRTDYDFDVNGNLRTVTEAGNKTTTLDYDNLNRLLTVDTPLTALGSHFISNHYINGNRDSVTDANGHTTTFAYNDEGQVTAITSPLITNLTPQQQYVTRFTYGGNSCPSCGGSGGGNLVALQDARNPATNFEYDFLNRLKSEADPLNETTSYFYNSKWNLDHKIDAKNRTTTYDYDVLKRLTGIRYQDNSTTSNVTYGYDDVLRTRTVANGDISYTYQYNAAWQLTQVTDNRGYAIDYEYYPSGERSKMTLQKGTAYQRVFDYTYDDAGRPDKITSAAGQFTYHYDGRGRRDTLTYPGASPIVATFSYDDASRLTGISHASGATPITATTYPVIDKVGNRKTKVTNGSQSEYVYDEIDRLITASGSNPESFLYDEVGNRTSGPGAKDTAYAHDAANRMTHGRKLGYGYDDNGNQTTRTDTTTPGKNWTLTWDDENRLIRAEVIKGTERKTVTFTYDPMGRRVGKQLVTVINGVTQPSTTWSYVYDGSDIVLEIYTVQNTTPERTVYTHGAGVDEHLAMERGNASASSFYFFHQDGLNSVTAITNASKSIVQSYTYDSFGMPKPTGSFRNSYTYTGREWDKETGLHFYRARYYDPMEGRFISKDPIGFAGGDVNLYRYALGNPIRYIDPSGLDVQIIISNRTYSPTRNSVAGRIAVTSDKVPNTFYGYTMENAHAGHKGNKPPIPAGTYDAITRTDHTPNRVELQDVPGYQNIQIHNGSYPRNFIGCFGAGTTHKTDFLGGTVNAMKKINEVIKADGTGNISVVVGPIQ